MRVILERAPNTAVDHETAEGVTALLAVAQYHHADVLRLLADCGGDVNFTWGHDVKTSVAALGDSAARRTDKKAT